MRFRRDEKIFVLLLFVSIIWCYHMLEHLNAQNSKEPSSIVSTREAQKKQEGQLIARGFNPHLLLLIRVPNSGTGVLAALLDKLSTMNRFSHRKEQSDQPLVTDESRVGFARQFFSRRTSPVSEYVPTVFFNFAQLGHAQNPVWLVMIRDPVQKFIANFRTKRKVLCQIRLENHLLLKGETLENCFQKDIEDCVLSRDPECALPHGREVHSSYSFTIGYFCGSESFCRVMGSKKALDQAKRNAEQFFPVVGVVEDLHNTFAKLEEILPTYFTGVDLLFHHLSDIQKNEDREVVQIDEEPLEVLQQALSLEIDFYNHIRHKLQKSVL
ncbi:hypothetical protein TCAL_03166 [Tigriopus californicus]|uniref:Sulfotransferase domain-containing protein n=1 Tax=Tigriopus californicus TaxID=6832 RepID=A0A553N7N6_TIGCA|nr:uronyl 2-sulfotransferase-like [Tigriopus californicus]TRY61458.1 hypothetical protein TCAL_03166 [Tigriopus californicus]